MRCCRGRSVEESIYNNWYVHRKTNSGEYATDWAARGKEVGRVMLALKASGKCDGCHKFGKERPSQAVSDEFEATWGKPPDEPKESSCLLHTDAFSERCPEVDNFYAQEEVLRP